MLYRNIVPPAPLREENELSEISLGQFVCDTEFIEGEIRQIVLYEDDFGRIHLVGGEKTLNVSSFAQDPAMHEAADVFVSIKERIKECLPEHTLGSHREIIPDVPKEKVHGGATALKLGSTLFVVGRSGDFGSINKDFLKICAYRSGYQSICHKHV